MVLNNEAGCDIGRLEERQVGTISDGNLRGRFHLAYLLLINVLEQGSKRENDCAS